MRDAMLEMFDTLLGGEPPMGLTAERVRHLGRRRAHRRRVLVAAGSAATVGLLGTAALGIGPDPIGAASTQTGLEPVPTAVPTAAPTAVRTSAPPAPSAPVLTRAVTFEVPRCDGDGSALSLKDTDGSLLPDPDVAAQAVLAAAATIAPGRTFTLVVAQRVDSAPKHPGSPRAYLVFDVSDADGTGSINLELIPHTGASADQRARADLRAKPFSNCTPATRTDFTDGAVGLAYVAFGTGRPSDTVQHTYYYGSDGLDIDAGTFLEPWNTQSARTMSPSVAKPGRTVSMPLSSAEALAIARLVATVG